MRREQSVLLGQYGRSFAIAKRVPCDLHRLANHAYVYRQDAVRRANQALQRSLKRLGKSKNVANQADQLIECRLLRADVDAVQVLLELPVLEAPGNQLVGVRQHVVHVARELLQHRWQFARLEIGVVLSDHLAEQLAKILAQRVIHRQEPCCRTRGYVHEFMQQRAIVHTRRITILILDHRFAIQLHINRRLAWRELKARNASGCIQ